jgi:transglutaminase-like putative cysteine protease
MTAQGTQLRVQHCTEYRYPLEAKDSFNELWVSPVDSATQSLQAFQLQVDPEVMVRSRDDYFGNRVHYFHVATSHRLLRIASRAEVLTFPAAEPRAVEVASLEPLRPRFFEFLAPTRRIPLQGDWAALLGFPLPGMRDDLLSYLLAAAHHLHARFTYRVGATSVDTPLQDFIASGQGVCQDFAQAMLALLRQARLPARYVSGYLATGVGAEGSHAWIEAFFPGTGWVGIDPTNDCPAGISHVKVAHGRDYDDCPPLRGVRLGGGMEQLSVEVRVEVGP